jgi:hypothetical protein
MCGDITRQLFDRLICSPRSAGKMLRMIRRLKSSRRASSYTFDEYRSTPRADAARASSFVRTRSVEPV